MSRAPVRRRGRRSLAAAFVALVLGAVLAAAPPPASADTGGGHYHFFARSTAVLGYEGYTAEVKLHKTRAFGAVTFNIGYSGATGGFSKTADLTSAPSTVTIPSGQHEATVSIPIASDSLQEQDESVVLTFTTSASNYHPLHPNSDPNAPSALNKVKLTIPANKYYWAGHAAVYEGQRAVVDLWLSTRAPTGGLEFSVANNLGTTGAATADDVDAILPTSVTVPAGQRRASLSIPIKQDTGAKEETETFTLTFSTTTAGWAPFNNNDSVGDYNTATVTIWGDELECHEFPRRSECSSTESAGAPERAAEGGAPGSDRVPPVVGGQGPSESDDAPGESDEPEWPWQGPSESDGAPDESEGPGSQQSEPGGATESATESVTRPAGQHAALVAQVRQWRDDPCCAHSKGHTDRWDRVLVALGETVADTTLTAMTAAEAQAFVNRGWTRWTDVAAALEELESASQRAALIAQIHGWRDDPRWSWQAAHVARWDRALLALGETVADATLTPMTAAEAQAFVDRGWTRWTDVAAALKAIEAG
ncbi:hypothetical protein [Candidatus Poriferisodalis sp.]|uniref:hypothetical protein n=1 Tax=Candidatus Poriferisodalis sp. TaxID=3101277 RepID=UPI003B01B453